MAMIVALATIMLMMTTTTTGEKMTDEDSATKAAYIKKMCEQAEYPDICKATVVQYASTIKTQSVHDMANAALQAALAHAGTALAWAKAASKNPDLSGRERQEASVCIDNLDDAHQQTLKTLKGLRGSSSSFNVNDWQTWMSAALTDDDTCLDTVSKGNDGPGPSPSPNPVTKFTKHATSLMTNVSHVTANSLVFVNKLAHAS